MADLRSRIPASVPPAIVFVVVGAGFVRVLMSNWREGAVIMAAGLVVAALLRLVLPAEQAGVLAVRSRAVDVVCYLVPAAVMILTAITIVRGHITLS